MATPTPLITVVSEITEPFMTYRVLPEREVKLFNLPDGWGEGCGPTGGVLKAGTAFHPLKALEGMGIQTDFGQIAKQISYQVCGQDCVLLSEMRNSSLLANLCVL